MASKKDNEFLLELYRKGLISADSIMRSFDGKPLVDLAGHESFHEPSEFAPDPDLQIEAMWTHETMKAREEHARRKRVKQKMKERQSKTEW